MLSAATIKVRVPPSRLWTGCLWAGEEKSGAHIDSFVADTQTAAYEAPSQGLS